MPAKRPNFVSYGLACTHDVVCPVYWDVPYSAVYDMNDFVFQPSWEAQADGYVILRVKSPRIRKWLQRLFPARSHGGWPIEGKSDSVRPAPSQPSDSKREENNGKAD